MNYLFDTDHMSTLQRSGGADFQRLQRQIAAHPTDDLFVSIVSFHEQTSGCHAIINQARNTPDLVRRYAFLNAIWESYRTLPVVDFDTAAGGMFDQLVSAHPRTGRMDLRIAAVALANGMTLLTRNRADFGPIANLAIEDWIT